MHTPDHKEVNFSQVHELKDILYKYNKSGNEENIQILRELGKKAKKELNRSVLTHGEFYRFIEKHLGELENKKY